MKKVIYKNKVVFDSFDFFGWEDDYEYRANQHEIGTISDYEACLTHACPECVKQYGLYDEAEASPAEIENELHKYKVFKGYTCKVEGCRNMDAYVLNLDLHECKLK